LAGRRVAALVAVRAALLQVPRRHVEVAAAHAERPQHVLLGVDLVLVARELRDRARGEHDARVAVREPAARRELDLRVGHHRDQLRPLRRLVRVPVLVAAPRPRRAAEAGRMRQQVAKRDRADVAERIVHGAQLGREVDGLLVEPQEPAVAQLHQRDARERLRAARPVEDRVAVDRALLLAVGEAVRGEAELVGAAHEQQAAADDAVLLARAVEAGLDLAPRFVELERLRRLRAQRHHRGEDGGPGGGGLRLHAADGSRGAARYRRLSRDALLLGDTGAVQPLSTNLDDPDAQPYFVWDVPVTVRELRRACTTPIRTNGRSGWH